MRPAVPFVKVVDDLAPEDVAMLQAFYSRSSASVLTHLERVQRTGSARFMEQHYVGYNHKSIGDCGSTTLFFEGVSLLAAKAIQDWPLYSGQETSTRYVDMTAQPIVDPIGSRQSAAILEQWMGLYQRLLPIVEEGVRRRYPQREGEPREVYDRAVKARTFDITRCFLPAGVTTQLSWHTNLRQVGDHMLGLAHHPLEELRTLTRMAREELGARYVSSRPNLGLAAVSGVAPSQGAADRLAWERQVAELFTYQQPLFAEEDRTNPNLPEVVFWTDVHAQLFNDRYLLPYESILADRPRGTILPHFMADLGQIHFDFPLDFGSFRDAQRHGRSGTCRMPLLTTKLGFEPWYLTQLELCFGGDATKQAMQLELLLGIIEYIKRQIDRLDCTPEVRQYYIPLGFRVPVSLSHGLPAAIYILELCSSKTVHPTLRQKMLQAADAFHMKYPWVALHVDRDPDDWDIRRGTQTILPRSELAPQP